MGERPRDSVVWGGDGRRVQRWSGSLRPFLCGVLWVLLGCLPVLAASSEGGGRGPRRIGVLGLHGGVFPVLRDAGERSGFVVESLDGDFLAGEPMDLSGFDVLLLQHLQRADQPHLRELLLAASESSSPPVVLSVSGLVESLLPELVERGIVRSDEAVTAYYRAAGEENLRRLLVYVGITFFGEPGEVQPPVLPPEGAVFHPARAESFPNFESYLAFETERLPKLAHAPRVVVTAHHIHRLLQQPLVVAALVASLEEHGLLPVVLEDNVPGYADSLREVGPSAVLHTCHSFESVDLRKELGVIHAHSIFFRRQSIDEWRASPRGLDPGTAAFEITSQEILGGIEPQIGAGTEHGHNSSEELQPIPGRIEHIVDRVAAWIRLRTLSNAEKRIAIVYYNREMGKADIMRGSATGMFMNAPRSLMAVLERMQSEGYGIDDLPENEDELLRRMVDHGHQIGAWDPEELDRVARTGEAVLVPEQEYARWFEAHVVPERRQEVIEKWGPVPGRIQVWTREDGARFLVLPRVSIGDGVVLLPQPLRGEAHDTSLAHDRLVPPSHNYLATYFWLQDAFRADAVVHFGTHGTEFLLPGKSLGPSGEDWGDLILGSMPNITPWVINNLGESSPVKRRSYAVLVDHLVPPSVTAGLADDLRRLKEDIEKWAGLDEGSVREGFLSIVSKEVRESGLGTDLGLEGLAERDLEPSEIDAVRAYLTEISEETTPIRLHTFGSPPSQDELRSYLVTCLGKGFRQTLATLFPPTEREQGDEEYRALAEGVVDSVVRLGLDPEQAVVAAGGEVPAGGLPRRVLDGLELAPTLRAGFAGATDEMDHLLGALAGEFVPPGPGNSPDRNAGVLPTGRNMVVMNPEEVPSKPSWEVGKKLVDEFLAAQLESRGRYPHKVAFTLNSFATFQDYGVMEAQILYMIGVRPVWDARNQVAEVELIPREELGRPRIDVFIAALSYYRDMLPTRMRLIDRAIRFVSDLEEEDNGVRSGSARVHSELRGDGMEEARARELSLARIFGYPPGQMGSAGYYYLVERSGTWDTSEDLMSTYLTHASYAYTGDIWGEEAPETYRRQVQGAEVVLRSWSDRTRSPLSNKYDWYIGGSLSRAITQLTGEQPEYLFSDVRDPDDAKMVRSEDVLRREYRVRLFNRKWLEGMMQEGYAGADQVAKHVSNSYGWAIMRDGAVGDDIWEEIVETVIHDKLELGLRDWFERENPFAYQETTEILLEAIRKGYFHADEATRKELAREYAASVAKHGEGGGMLGGGNEKLDRFIEDLVGDVVESEPLAMAPSAEPIATRGEKPASEGTPESADSGEAEAVPSSKASPEPDSPRVEGRALTPVSEEAAAPEEDSPLRWAVLVGFALVTAGFLARRRGRAAA